MENKNNKPLGSQPQPTKKRRGFNISWIYTLLILGLGASLLFTRDGTTKKVSYSELQEYIHNGAIDNITVFNTNVVEAQVAENSLQSVFGEKYEEFKEKRTITCNIPSVEELSRFMTTSEFKGKVTYEEGRNYFTMFLVNVLPFALIILFFIFLNRRMMGGGGAGGGIFNVGKSKAQVFEKGGEQMKTTFKDVAGLAGAKQEIEEIVAFLKNPSKYTELGGKIPKGALLVGPPGTGKTLLAKAVAGEADVPFFSMSGSDFVEMFVGVGASRVRDLFRQAKEKSPCIIFIDEIDAIGRARGSKVSMGGNDERENTLNQLLTEMDGFGTNSGVIILAATNRADVLDSALLRAGRFDRQIHVDLPDLAERKEILEVHLRPLKLDETVEINFLAKQTPGFSGADIANVCNEAALIAARKDKRAIGKQDFMDAVDRIVGGLEKKTKVMTDDEKRSIAYHEAGHATISWMLQYANPLVKVTIVPRGMALGAAWYLPEERQLTNYTHILDEMCSTLGGRAAEELFLKQTSTGALNDLERVTKQAYAMVAYYGMSSQLSNISYYDSSGHSDYGFTKPYSEKTAEMIDNEARNIIQVQYNRAKQILAENTQGHNKIAELLLEQEVITSDDVQAILGVRPWKSRQEELMEMNTKVLEQEAAKALLANEGNNAGKTTQETQPTGEPTSLI